jgi:hypothetical protein
LGRSNPTEFILYTARTTALFGQPDSGVPQVLMVTLALAAGSKVYQTSLAWAPADAVLGNVETAMAGVGPARLSEPQTVEFAARAVAVAGVSLAVEEHGPAQPGRVKLSVPLEGVPPKLVTPGAEIV